MFRVIRLYENRTKTWICTRLFIGVIIHIWSLFWALPSTGFSSYVYKTAYFYITLLICCMRNVSARDHKAVRRTVPFVIISVSSLLSCLSCDNVSEFAYSGSLQIKLNRPTCSLYRKPAAAETFHNVAKFRTTKNISRLYIFPEILWSCWENPRVFLLQASTYGYRAFNKLSWDNYIERKTREWKKRDIPHEWFTGWDFWY